MFSPAVRFSVRENGSYMIYRMGRTLVGDGPEEGRLSMANGEEWRRPWLRARVPGEGPANVEGWSEHEHRGIVGVRFQYLVRLEVGWKGVVGVDVDLELLRWQGQHGICLDSNRGEGKLG
jgi:hypothetical protein